MPKVAQKYDEHGRMWITIAQVMREMGGRSRERVLTDLSNLGIQRDADGYVALVDVAQMLARMSGEEKQFQNEHERLSSIRADREQLKLQEDRRELVQAEQVRRETATFAKPIVDELRAYPQTFERQCNPDPDVLEYVTRTMAGLMERVYDGLMDIATDRLAAPPTPADKPTDPPPPSTAALDFEGGNHAD